MIRGLVFVDTWAYRALTDRRDGSHDHAVGRMRRLSEASTRFVTTNYIIDEAITGIRQAANGPTAVRFGSDIRDLVARSELQLEWIDERRDRAAWRLFERYVNVKRLSFTDCTSFAVMLELGIEHVLTNDACFDRVNLGFVRV